MVDASADNMTDALEVLVRVESPFRLRVGGGGPPQPLHVTAAGKALLAGPPARSEALLGFGQALQRYGPRTITDEVLRREIDRVRIRGVATAVDELEEGVASAAAPVRRDGALAGVIVVDGPASRIAQARVLPRIVDRLAEKGAASRARSPAPPSRSGPYLAGSLRSAAIADARLVAPSLR